MRYAPFVLITIVLGAFVAWFAPAASGPAREPAAMPGRTADARLDAAREQSWNSGDTVLARAGDGHFYAEVTVDGIPTRMLVDTGASMVALTGEDADAMGIAWDQNTIEHVARGAGGPVYGVRVTIDRMQLGEFEARSVRAVVVPEGLRISLLGQSFLAQIPHVAMEQDRMVFGGQDV